MAEIKSENTEAGQADIRTSRVRRRRYWRGPLIQFAVVVAGILVTFQGSAWIERSRQRSQARDILAMVNTELRQNLLELERIERIGQLELDGMAFVSNHVIDICKAPRDSLDMYIRILGAGPEFFYSSNTLEVLKASPSAVNVMDKELLRQIFLCYDELGKFVSSVNYYFRQKFSLVGELYYSIDLETVEKMRSGEDPYLFAEKYMANIPTRNHALNAADNLSSMLLSSEGLIEAFEQTIMETDKYVKKQKPEQSGEASSSGNPADDPDVENAGKGAGDNGEG